MLKNGLASYNSHIVEICVFVGSNISEDEKYLGRKADDVYTVSSEHLYAEVYHLAPEYFKEGF